MADAILEQIAVFIQPLRVKPGAKVTLADDFDPRYKAGFVNRKEARSVLQQGVDLLSEYQTRLAAQATHGLLVCLQGLDAAGKDGTIRHVMSGVNPQGVRVTSFKSPSSSELAHDFLWRHAVRLPARGEIAIFNRSHYEEVLVVRVHPELLERQNIPNLPKGHGVWSRRYRDINDWERYLDDNGIKIVKLFLNLSKDEQRVRFLRRLDVPDRNWKFWPRTSGSVSTGPTISGPTRTCCQPPAPSALRGTSSRRIASGSLESACRQCWRIRSSTLIPSTPR